MAKTCSHILNIKVPNYIKSTIENMIKSHDRYDDEYIYDLSAYITDDKRNFQNEIKKFKDSNFTVLNLSGLPVDKKIPLTPYSGYIDNNELPQATFSHSLVLNLLGIHPISYHRENKGLLIRQVVPTKKRSLNASSHGSKLTLDMHVSNPILPITGEDTLGVSACPEYLSFYGIRHDENIKTEVVSLVDVLDQLSNDVKQELSKNKFFFRMPSSFNGNEINGPFPIISRVNGEYFNRTDMDTVIPSDEASLKALISFVNASNNPKYKMDFVLKQGEMLIFKNQKTLHARRSFEAKFDGYDRWIMRMYGTDNLERHHSLSDSKPFIGVTYG